MRAANHENNEPESAASRSASGNPAEILEQELAHLHKQEAAGMFRYAALLTRDCGYAQDAVQEVFLRYFVARTEGQRFSNTKAWLFKVLRNHLIDANRAGQRRVEVGLEEIREPADTRDNLDTRLHARDTMRQLMTVLAPRERECVRLRSEGLRYEEIAEVLAVRSGTVGALLARAHSKIRKYLNKEGYITDRRSRLTSASEPEGSPYAS